MKAAPFSFLFVILLGSSLDSSASVFFENGIYCTVSLAGLFPLFIFTGYEAHLLDLITGDIAQSNIQQSQGSMAVPELIKELTSCTIDISTYICGYRKLFLVGTVLEIVVSYGDAYAVRSCAVPSDPSADMVCY